MTNIYDQINFCLDLLYNSLYSDNDCYKLMPIDINEINILDIKKDKSFDFSYSLEGEVEYLYSDNNKYVFKKKYDVYAANLAIGVYSKDNNNYDDMLRPEINNMLFSYIISETGIRNKLRHILYPVFNFDITLDKLYKINKTIAGKIKEGDLESQLYVNITENYHKMMTLESYLRKNINNIDNLFLKKIIFQILYTLYTVQKGLTMFRHNKLDLDAIKVCIKDKEENYVYVVGDQTFNIDNNDVEIKISNFEYATFNNYNKRDLPDNPYYDIHYFITKLEMFFKKIDYTNPEFYIFYESVIIKEFRNEDGSEFKGLNENLYFDKTSNILTPSIIIRKNNFFSNFIKKTMKSTSDNNNMSSSSLTESDSDIKFLGKNINSINNKISSNIKRMKSYEGKRKYNKFEKKKKSIVDMAEKGYNKEYNKDYTDIDDKIKEEEEINFLEDLDTQPPGETGDEISPFVDPEDNYESDSDDEPRNEPDDTGNESITETSRKNKKVSESESESDSISESLVHNLENFLKRNRQTKNQNENGTSNQMNNQMNGQMNGQMNNAPKNNIFSKFMNSNQMNNSNIIPQFPNNQQQIKNPYQEQQINHIPNNIQMQNQLSNQNNNQQIQNQLLNTQMQNPLLNNQQNQMLNNQMLNNQQNPLLNHQMLNNQQNSYQEQQLNNQMKNPYQEQPNFNQTNQEQKILGNVLQQELYNTQQDQLNGNQKINLQQLFNNLPKEQNLNQGLSVKLNNLFGQKGGRKKDGFFF